MHAMKSSGKPPETEIHETPEPELEKGDNMECGREEPAEWKKWMNIPTYMKTQHTEG
jgi:hypothetical protein